jgi:hypothetical protein
MKEMFLAVGDLFRIGISLKKHFRNCPFGFYRFAI